jgi:hypothetical protein
MRSSTFQFDVFKSSYYREVRNLGHEEALQDSCQLQVSKKSALKGICHSPGHERGTCIIIPPLTHDHYAYNPNSDDLFGKQL